MLLWAIGLGVLAVALSVASVTAAVTVVDQADLALTINAPDHVAVAATFTAHIAFENAGGALAPDVRVTATLPSGTQFVTSTDRWGSPLTPDLIAGNVIAWAVGSLPANSCCGHILLTLQTAPDLSEGTLLTTTAEIATTTIESDTTNNLAETVSVVCDMAGSIKQVHTGWAMPGDVLTYTLRLQYQHRAGEPNQRWVELTDTLPFSHQVRFLGWVGSITGTQHTSQALQWQGQVRAGEPLSLQYRLGVEMTVTPGTVITNGAVLRWSTGEMRLGPVTTVVTMSQNAYMCGPNGGEWAHQYGVTLTVPPHAVTETTRFQFREMSPTEIISGPPGLLYAHRAFELTAFRFGEVHQFGQPLTITLHYSDTNVIGLKRETLRLWYRNSAGEPWAMLGEPVRVMSGTLSFTTTHFTQFALFADGAYQLYLPHLTR
jgi:uncharacterized repeat protein (TIGR01451 family)